MSTSVKRPRSPAAESLDDDDKPKRQATGVSPAAAAAAAAPAKPDPLREAMPRTARVVDDQMIAVRQRDSGWIAQAVTMKNLRQTKSLFIDVALDLDEHSLEIPADTCSSQEDFIKLFTVDMYVSSVYVNQTRMCEAWDKLGFHEKVTKHLNDLEKRRAWVYVPDACTLFRWGRRFKRPKLVRMACMQLLASKYNGPAPEPDMVQELLNTARELMREREKIRVEIKAFRDSAIQKDCDDDCPKSCDGDSDQHPVVDFTDTTADNYNNCAVAVINTIAECVRDNASDDDSD